MSSCFSIFGTGRSDISGLLRTKSRPNCLSLFTLFNIRVSISILIFLFWGPKINVHVHYKLFCLLIWSALLKKDEFSWNSILQWQTCYFCYFIHVIDLARFRKHFYTRRPVICGLRAIAILRVFDWISGHELFWSRYFSSVSV